MVDATGNVQNSYSYDAFGNTTAYTGKVENRFRYTGEQQDTITGQYYLRARYYDPAKGSFISEDTYPGQIEEPLSLNLYTYCINNPVKYIDPTGHDKKCAGGEAGGGGLDPITATYVLYEIIKSIYKPILIALGIIKVTPPVYDMITDISLSTDADIDNTPTPCPAPTRPDTQGAENTQGNSESDVTQGKSRAPSKGDPGSTYEQVDDKGNVVSRTKYGSNGKPESRQDYTHEHYSKEEGEYLQPHQHNYTYNANGQPTGETVTRIK